MCSLYLLRLAYNFFEIQTLSGARYPYCIVFVGEVVLHLNDMVLLLINRVVPLVLSHRVGTS